MPFVVNQKFVIRLFNKSKMVLVHLTIWSKINIVIIHSEHIMYDYDLAHTLAAHVWFYLLYWLKLCTKTPYIKGFQRNDAGANRCIISTCEWFKENRRKSKAASFSSHVISDTYVFKNCPYFEIIRYAQISWTSVFEKIEEKSLYRN